jgi:hypothetical protein
LPAAIYVSKLVVSSEIKNLKVLWGTGRLASASRQHWNRAQSLAL